MRRIQQQSSEVRSVACDQDFVVSVDRNQRLVGLIIRHIQTGNILSLVKPHMLHLHLFPFSMKVTNGLMYVRHLLHRAMTVSETTGTGFSSSRRVIYGRIVNANGSLVFLRRELLCGIHPSVERIYSGGQLECSELVRDVC